MTIASAQTIAALRPLSPLEPRTSFGGLTYGLGPAGYDVRVAECFTLATGQFILASTLERFEMPDILLGVVHDKSTWARQGLCVQNTVIEPGWQGYLTLELTNHGAAEIVITRGLPIAQIVFHLLDRPTDRPYRGRYNFQDQGPQPAIIGGDNG